MPKHRKKHMLIIIILAIVSIGVAVQDAFTYTSNEATAVVNKYASKNCLNLSSLKLIGEYKITLDDLKYTRLFFAREVNEHPTQLLGKTVYIFRFVGTGFDTDSKESQNLYDSKVKNSHSGMSQGKFYIVNNRVIGGYVNVKFNKPFYGGGHPIMDQPDRCISIKDHLDRWERDIKQLEAASQ